MTYFPTHLMTSFFLCHHFYFLVRFFVRLLPRKNIYKNTGFCALISFSIFCEFCLSFGIFFATFFSTFSSASLFVCLFVVVLPHPLNWLQLKITRDRNRVWIVNLQTSILFYLLRFHSIIYFFKEKLFHPSHFSLFPFYLLLPFFL